MSGSLDAGDSRQTLYLEAYGGQASRQHIGQERLQEYRKSCSICHPQRRCGGVEKVAQQDSLVVTLALKSSHMPKYAAVFRTSRAPNNSCHTTYKVYLPKIVGEIRVIS